jgi:hypothetical protein
MKLRFLIIILFCAFVGIGEVSAQEEGRWVRFQSSPQIVEIFSDVRYAENGNLLFWTRYSNDITFQLEILTEVNCARRQTRNLLAKEYDDYGNLTNSLRYIGEWQDADNTIRSAEAAFVCRTTPPRWAIPALNSRRGTNRTGSASGRRRMRVRP